MHETCLQAAEQSLAQANEAGSPAVKGVEPRAQVAALENAARMMRAQIREERAAQDSARAEAEQAIGLLKKNLAQSQSWAFQLVGERRAAEQVAAELRQRLKEETERARRARATSERSQYLYDRKVAQLSELQARLDEAEASARDRLDQALATVAAARWAEQEAQGSLSGLEDRLHERIQEITLLTSLLRQQEDENLAARSQAEWLRAYSDSIRSQPRHWALLPAKWRIAREQDHLRREGVFDGQAYLERYPDVAEAGLDPLYHYLAHGLREGRLWAR